MPEIVEYSKLQRQLLSAWPRTRVTNISAPPQSPNPRKYLQGDWGEFRRTLTTTAIDLIDRHGKMLYVRLDSGHTWQIHLSSTGWFMPGNEAAHARAAADPIHRNFLHAIHDANIRVRFHLGDGQKWNYHDSRTWGKWWLRPPDWPRPERGPDWLKDPTRARNALKDHQSRRTAKDVLCDQHVTAGLGNYLACETLWRAGIHPHTRWHRTTPQERDQLGWETTTFLNECLARADHGHWGVFGKAGEPCPKHPDQCLLYAKDGTNGKRGSYYCGTCQVPRT